MTEEQPISTWNERNSAASTPAEKQALAEEYSKVEGKIRKCVRAQRSNMSVATAEVIEAKALDRFLRESRGIRPEQYAEWEAAIWFRNHRESQAAKGGDSSETTTDGVTDAPVELNAYAAQYAEHLGVDVGEVLTDCRAGKLKFERDRLRRPGHYFEDEREAAFLAVRANCVQEYSDATELAWGNELELWVQALRLDCERAVKEEKLSMQILDEVAGPLEAALFLIATTPPALDLRESIPIGLTIHDDGELRVPAGPNARALTMLHPQIAALHDRLKEVQSLREELTTTVTWMDGHPVDGKTDDAAKYEFVRRAVALRSFRQRTSFKNPPSAREIAIIWVLSGGEIEKRNWKSVGHTARELMQGCCDWVAAYARALNLALR